MAKMLIGLALAAMLAAASAPSFADPVPCPSGASESQDCGRPVGRSYGRAPASHAYGPTRTERRKPLRHRHGQQRHRYHHHNVVPR